MNIQKLFIRAWYYDVVGNPIRFVYIAKLLDAVKNIKALEPIRSRQQEAA